MKLDRFLIILALQTLLEQVKDAEDQTYADRINKEITKERHNIKNSILKLTMGKPVNLQ